MSKLFVHPQLWMRLGLRELVEYFAKLNLRMSSARTVSGKSVLVLKPPPQETRND